MCPKPMNAIFAITYSSYPGEGRGPVQKRNGASAAWPRPSPGYSLSAFPIPRPFLDESSHAFLLVLGPEQAVEQAALESDALAQRDLERRIDHLLDRDRG